MPAPIVEARKALQEGLPFLEPAHLCAQRKPKELAARGGRSILPVLRTLQDVVDDVLGNMSWAQLLAGGPRPQHLANPAPSSCRLPQGLLFRTAKEERGQAKVLVRGQTGLRGPSDSLTEVSYCPMDSQERRRRGAGVVLHGSLSPVACCRSPNTDT